MADPLVIHSDLEFYLTGRFRKDIADRPEPVCAGVEVLNREPDPSKPFPKKAVIVRDDSGPTTSIVTADRSVGVSVLAETYEDAVDLALIVHALGGGLAGMEPGNPIAAVLGSNGPFSVPESQPRFRRYMTFDLSVVGSAL